MTPRDFAFWLTGYLEALELPTGFKAEPHLAAIRRAVDIVISDIEDPDYVYSVGTQSEASE